MTTWEALEEIDHQAFWEKSQRLPRLDHLEGDLLGDSGILNAQALLSGHGQERVKHKDRRSFVAFILGSLLAGGVVTGVVSMLTGDGQPTRVPAQFTKVAPEILRPLLQNRTALAATGTCAADLRAQAQLELHYQQRASTHEIPKKYRDRPKLFADAAVSAEREQVPCTPTNKVGEYDLRTGNLNQTTHVISRSDIVRFDVSSPAWWCDERERVQVQLDKPRAAHDTDPRPAYWQEELLVGDALMRSLGHTCADQ